LIENNQEYQKKEQAYLKEVKNSSRLLSYQDYQKKDKAATRTGSRGSRRAPDQSLIPTSLLPKFQQQGESPGIIVPASVLTIIDDIRGGIRNSLSRA
jgi:hypothetical protein